MLFAASIPYMEKEQDRQQTLNILKPRIGFITEPMSEHNKAAKLNAQKEQLRERYIKRGLLMESSDAE